MSNTELTVVAVTRTAYNWAVLVEIDRDTLYMLTTVMMDQPSVGSKLDLQPAIKRMNAMAAKEREIRQIQSGLRGLLSLQEPKSE